MSFFPSHAPARLELEIRSCRKDDLRLLEWHGAFSEHRQIINQTFARQRAGKALMLLAITTDFPVGQV